MLEEILESIKIKIANVALLKDLQQIKVEILGKSGPINQEMQKLGKAKPEERKFLGQQINSVKQKIEQLICEKYQELEAHELQLRLQLEKIDITQPARTIKKAAFILLLNVWKN